MGPLQIFVASSSEGVEVARALQYQLKDVGSVRLWNEGVFGLGRTTIESLEEAVRVSDIAVLVLRADELLIKLREACPTDHRSSKIQLARVS